MAVDSFSSKNNVDWSEDIDSGESGLPLPTKKVEADGSVTIVEYKLNDDGKKVKVTKKIRMKLIKTNVNHDIAQRKKWAKFGDAKGFPPGPDTDSTTMGEIVSLKLSTNLYAAQQQEEAANKVAPPAAAKILCRICNGNHWTTRCPFKDTHQPLNELKKSETPAPADKRSSGAASGKYIPPSMRGGAAGASTEGSGYTRETRRDDSNTIRISNLTEDATEADIRDLVTRFGSVSRIFVARDKELNICKGFAFVTYHMRSSAELAIARLNGHGYDNLILRVDWSKKD